MPNCSVRPRRLAARIATQVPAHDARIAVLCGADRPRIVAQIGVVLSGRCLVVLDAKAPAAWHATILADCTPGAVVFDAAQAQAAAALAGGFTSGAVTLLPVTATAPSPVALPDASARGRDLAAIIYTSGSTGSPEGRDAPARFLSAHHPDSRRSERHR